MDEDNPCNLWLFLSLLKVDKEDLHEIAKHGGDAYLSSTKIDRPL